MKRLEYNIENLKADSISKFNIYNQDLITKLKNLIIFSKLSVNDPNFLRDFFFLSKLFFYWFDKKISILQVITDKKKAFNKGKSALTFFFGCTIRKIFLIKNVNYMNNIVFNLTRRVDGSIKHRKIDSGFVYTFSNVNFLLGFRSERFFNSNIKINVFYNFSQIEKKNKINFFNKKIINFYEKVFF
jgi:hypothetical protein